MSINLPEPFSKMKCERFVLPLGEQLTFATSVTHLFGWTNAPSFLMNLLSGSDNNE